MYVNKKNIMTKSQSSAANLDLLLPIFPVTVVEKNQSSKIKNR